MGPLLLVHVVAGALGLLSGYVALGVAKGAPLHRQVGMLFVYVMVTMAVTGMLVSAVQDVGRAVNIPSALLTLYLVITSLTTVRPRDAGSRRLDLAGLAMALAIGLGCVAVGIAAIVRGGAAAGVAYPLFMFAIVAGLAAEGDRRMLRDGGTRGARRLTRHLWRMCFALFIASMAFYLGKGRVPEMFRIPALLASAVLLPIAAMSYWFWRLRAGRASRRIIPVRTPDAVVSA